MRSRAPSTASAGAGPRRPIDARGKQHGLDQRLVVVQHQAGRHEHDPPARQPVQGARHGRRQPATPDDEHERRRPPTARRPAGAARRPAPATARPTPAGRPEQQRARARAAAGAARRRRTSRSTNTSPVERREGGHHAPPPRRATAERAPAPSGSPASAAQFGRRQRGRRRDAERGEARRAGEEHGHEHRRPRPPGQHARRCARRRRLCRRARRRGPGPPASGSSAQVTRAGQGPVRTCMARRDLPTRDRRWPFSGMSRQGEAVAWETRTRMKVARPSARRWPRSIGSLPHTDPAPRPPSCSSASPACRPRRRSRTARAWSA